MRHTMVSRPFTQISSGGAPALNESMEDVAGGFMLDLRDECTATAKLEKLKAKYQRVTAAKGV